MNSLIASHFKNKDFDIRKKHPGYSRFMDQKITPDVISFIADCTLNLSNTSDFTVKDILTSDYFEKNTKAIFGKPAPSNSTSFAEYNKFVGQPLKTFSYAKILNEKKKGRINHYSINNRNLLEYISLNERGAYDFLYEYIVKTLTDSGFFVHLKNYSDQIYKKFDSMYFDILKLRFQRFMLGNTKIKGKIEINRIFPKILNPFAVRNRVPGSEKGRITKYSFAYSDLMYNRTNFRDIKKAKGVSRQELALVSQKTKQRNYFAKYRIAKAKQLVRRKYSSSEMRDQWANGQATQIHHMFPQSRYPRFAAYVENLIKLTPEQHFSHAHPNARTQEVNKDYQIQCLLAKCDSIEKSVAFGEFIYSKESFINMLNICFDLNIDFQESFAEIREKLSAFQIKI